MGKTNGAAPKGKKLEVEDRELPVKLTNPELFDRADEMAAAELELELLQQQRSELSRRMNEVKKTRARLAHIIDTGVETRPVRCVWHEDFAKNVFRLKREDTGEEVDTRPMTVDDRTASLPFYEEPPPRSPKPRGKKSAVATA